MSQEKTGFPEGIPRPLFPSHGSTLVLTAPTTVGFQGNGGEGRVDHVETDVGHLHFVGVSMTGDW
jgi:hypothetical protein